MTKYYSGNHPDIAKGYGNLGLAYRKKGEHDNAIKFYNQSLTIFQKFFPNNHRYIKTAEKDLRLAQQAKDQQKKRNLYNYFKIFKR